MRRKLSGILFGLLFLVGFGILAYPTVSNQWNTYRQSRLISNYEQAVSDMQPEDYTKEWEAAREFDSTLVQNNIYGDVFGSDDVDMKDTDYWKVLNVAGDGVMGYLSIPKINIKLAIYHGTAEDVLQTGIGHMNGTSLPIGGESTPVDSMLRAIQNYYMLYLILGLAVTLLVILIMKFLFDRKNKKRSGKTDDMSKEG